MIQKQIRFWKKRLSVMCELKHAAQKRVSEKELIKSVLHVKNLSAAPIVCLGDSMTKGSGSLLSYPMVLQSLTGRKVFNFGIPGATSEELAQMADRGQIAKGHHIRQKYKQRYQKIKADVLILEFGSNGGWSGSPEKLIRQYRKVLKSAGCQKYIILGDTDDPINSADPAVRMEFRRDRRRGRFQKETAWEKALQKEFGSHFLNTRRYLLDHGMQILGWNPTASEEDAALRGEISCRMRSDWTHFNAFGYYVKAVGIFEKGRALHYW